MANLVTYLSEKMKPYNVYISVIFVLIVFLIASFFLYRQFSKDNLSQTKKFEDVANNGSRMNEITVRMFHVDWCPHCKTSLPEWQAFCDQYNGTKVNGYLIVCDRMGDNCTDDKNLRIKGMLDNYNITSFPTVFALKDDKRYDFDSKVTKGSLDQFVQYITSQIS
jgi:thiol-disulfide isomerase/thioredoxin